MSELEVFTLPSTPPSTRFEASPRAWLHHRSPTTYSQTLPSSSIVHQPRPHLHAYRSPLSLNVLRSRDTSQSTTDKPGLRFPAVHSVVSGHGRHPQPNKHSRGRQSEVRARRRDNYAKGQRMRPSRPHHCRDGCCAHPRLRRGPGAPLVLLGRAGSRPLALRGTASPPCAGRGGVALRDHA